MCTPGKWYKPLDCYQGGRKLSGGVIYTDLRIVIGNEQRKICCRTSGSCSAELYKEDAVPPPQRIHYQLLTVHLKWSPVQFWCESL